ncbi:MAG: histidinol dehydrogenase [Candidatus Diapherotrites archaeon]
MKIFKLNKMGKKDREFILNRSKESIGGIKGYVKEIIDDVRKRGDKAVIEYTKKFDKVELERGELKVSEKEFKAAFERISPKLLKAIKEQIRLSKKFQFMQLGDKFWMKEIFPGLTLGQKTTAIESVGLYVPGGTAAYPTVMQILAVPAKIAGVKKIVAVTPPRENLDALLVAAKLSGVDEVYRIGGIQAIAALAYGTETIPKVNKIVGPGNVYVTAAKELVFGEVAIDMPAGPSEALILADDSANPKYVAADILARAEHDENAAGVLVTDSRELAEKVIEEVERQKGLLERSEIIEKSLAKYSAIILAGSIEKAIDFANEYAPEHLEIITKDPWKTMEKIENAGSIFLGENAPVAIGDYASGVNHVLPTLGNAKMFSAIGVESFQKKTEFEFISKDALRKLEKISTPIAEYEGFDGHKKSIQIRLDKTMGEKK